MGRSKGTQEPTPTPIAAAAALDFILAGDARFTLVSGRTGVRYTYRVRRAKEREGQTAKVWFASLLTGQNNVSDYTYVGKIQNGRVSCTAASQMSDDSAPVAGLRWLINTLDNGHEPKNAEIWTTGHCGKCGLLLTVPESIAAGYGPECRGKIAAQSPRDTFLGDN